MSGCLDELADNLAELAGPSGLRAWFFPPLAEANAVEDAKVRWGGFLPLRNC